MIKTILICLAFTFLNPHVYLDTVFLVGSVSVQFKENVLLFWIGTTAASFFFFFSLGYGASLLRPLFLKPRAWQILDAFIALTMFTIAAQLLLDKIA